MYLNGSIWYPIFRFISNNLQKKNNDQIFTYLSFKINPSLPKIICDPEILNRTEVCTQLEKRRLCQVADILRFTRECECWKLAHA